MLSLLLHAYLLFSAGEHSALLGDIEVEKESENESSDSEDEDRSAKFDFGPPLLFSGDSIDLDSLPDHIKSRMETITIRRQMVGKLGWLTYLYAYNSELVWQLGHILVWLNSRL